MLKKSLLTVLFLLPQLGVAEGDKDYSVLTNVNEVKSVFVQCSRMTPGFRTSINLVTEETINKIEKMLPDVLKEMPKGKNINIDDYYRQYASFSILRREIVYVNAFHKDEIKKWAGDDPARKELIDNWRSRAISVCGGGTNYWGALYDSYNGKINEVIFNTSGKKN